MHVQFDDANFIFERHEATRQIEFDSVEPRKTKLSLAGHRHQPGPDSMVPSGRAGPLIEGPDLGPVGAKGLVAGSFEGALVHSEVCVTSSTPGQQIPVCAFVRHRIRQPGPGC